MLRTIVVATSCACIICGSSGDAGVSVQKKKRRGQLPVRRTSLAILQAEVQSLNVEKVAWRKIPWKTCLLDGLKASREQKKPLMLWIFIDRPIDDERC